MFIMNDKILEEIKENSNILDGLVDNVTEKIEEPKVKETNKFI